ncbi:hypothetical protein OsI_30403 [Oryza sativa Indica Group]|uniref:DOG1 domain-containing protein n=1 Tax=Oryza sativa subsp. indica TaxID=39946 RepID=A2YYH8_ORYSI|nr:hypothetical protein OsI_30403 [Oryza sativa Indica Group]
MTPTTTTTPTTPDSAEAAAAGRSPRRKRTRTRTRASSPSSPASSPAVIAPSRFLICGFLIPVDSWLIAAWFLAISARIGGTDGAPPPPLLRLQRQRQHRHRGHHRRPRPPPRPLLPPRHRPARPPPRRPCLLARTDDPPLAVAALSWLGGDLRPSCILLTLLPALFPTLPAHARHALSAAARRLHAREAALDGEVAEYQSTYAMKLACEKTKDGVAETAGEEMCKMARAARRADKLRWRAVEAAVKEVLTPAQAKEFLKAVEDVAARAARHGARWHARTGAVSVPVEVFDRMRANARAATDDAW